MGNATPHHPQPSHNGTILLVDDCETIRNVISRTLQDRGYRPMVAGSGAEALSTVKEASPDAVILDINLPDIDGYTVCKRIKCDPTTYRIPVLVLTDLEQSGFEVMAIDAGADDFVSKPPDPLVLDARLRMLI
jgi:DNA-binding response OmpR family regulator